MHKIIALTLLLSAALAAAAQDSAPAVRISIKPQETAAALLEFSHQTHLQIVSVGSEVKGHRSAGVEGALSVDAALKKLLEGTGLTFERINANTIRVFPLRTAGESEDSARAAQLEQVLVTGSRIPLTAKEQAQPVLVFSARDIDASGRTTVADFLNTVPQVSIKSTSGNFEAFGGQRGVQLHGLPLGTTLTLIDGLSLELGYYGPLDLSMIPTAAIERIEIIPVGSSAIYGSSALAGVVNIVTKKSFDGADVNVKYSSAADYNDNTASAAFGKGWGAGSASVFFSHQHQSGLVSAARELPNSGDYTSEGGRDWRITTCNPGTVYGVNGAPLTGLNASQAAIPRGLTGTATLADFAATAGTQNKCSQYVTLISPSDQTSLMVNAHEEVAAWLDLFTSLMYSNFRADFPTGAFLPLTHTSSIVSANNPYNPFGQAVGVDWAYGPQPYQRAEDFIHPLIGVRGAVGGDWHYEVTGLYSLDHYKILQHTVNAKAIQNALSSSDPATALNVFSSGDPGSQALLDSFYQSAYNHYRNSLTSAQAVVRGPLFTLPAGPVQGVFGADYEHATLAYQYVTGVNVDGARDSYAVFTEERVPLLASSAHPGRGAVLAASLAARYDHSNDFGSKATYQGGIEWRPTDAWLLRGAFGTSYRAPALNLLYGNTTTFSGLIVDPARGNSSYAVTLPYGPNRNLHPETGRSRSFGVVYSSAVLSGLEASATYWSVDYNNYIGTAGYQDVVNFPGDYPAGFVTRAAPTAADTAKNWLGPISSVQYTSVNFGTINVSGLDLDARYRIATDFGTWTPAVDATRTFKYDAALRPGQPQQDFLSQAAFSPGWAPRWKGNLSLSWDKGMWSAGMVGRYVGSYDDYNAYGGVQPHRLGNFWLFDANVHFDVGHAVLAEGSRLRNSYIALGGINLFDRAPQFSYYPEGFDYAQADILGRVVYLQAGLKF